MRLYQRFPTMIPSIVSAAMLALAVPPIWPYLYYQILRWVVCGLSIYSATISYGKKSKVLLVAYALIAILFNPIAPFRLSKTTWSVIDGIFAAVFVALIWFVRADAIVSSPEEENE
jgi:hypothetical protein